SWSNGRSAARPGPGAAPARSTCAPPSASGSIRSCGRCGPNFEPRISRRAARAPHEEDARGAAACLLRLVQEVRRHRVVPALELPHHGGVAAMPLLPAEACMKEEILYERGATLVRRLELGPSDVLPWHVDPFQRVSVVLKGERLEIEYRD